MVHFPWHSQTMMKWMWIWKGLRIDYIRVRPRNRSIQQQPNQEASVPRNSTLETWHGDAWTARRTRAASCARNVLRKVITKATESFWSEAYQDAVTAVMLILGTLIISVLTTSAERCRPQMRYLSFRNLFKIKLILCLGRYVTSSRAICFAYKSRII